MTERDTSQTSSQRPTDLILLRFPQEIREQVTQPSGALSSKELVMSPPPQHQKRKRRRWRRRLRNFALLCVLLVMGVSAWGLEQEYRSQRSQGQLLERFEKRLKNVEQTIAASQSREVYLSLPKYLNYLDGAFDSLRQSRVRHCTQQPSPPTWTWRWPRDRAQWQQRWRQYRRWLWSQLQPTYLQARALITPTATPASAAHRKKLCQNSASQVVKQFRARLHQSSQRLLDEAGRHLRWYGWCQMHWTRYQADLNHQRWLALLRQRRCRRSCQQSQSAECRSCLRQWQQSLQLSEERFAEYHKLVRLEEQRRCLYWTRKTKRPAHRGVFHLGEYFWRVRRVLTYTQWLQDHKMCDATCQKVQKDWGFRLQLTASSPTATIHVRLWPEQHKAPTSWLRQIPRQSLGYANGSTLWLPALRTDLLGSQVPQQYWMLLLLLDAKTRHKGLLPLTPEPGGSLQHKVQLRAMEIYNDGRLPVRYPTFSRDGKWLAFTTFQQLPWWPAPDFRDPHCWTTPPNQKVAGMWRSAISVYPINAEGQPLSNGHHQLTAATLHHLTFHPHHDPPQLLLSADLSPDPFTPGQGTSFDRSPSPLVPSTPEGEQASLWSLDLHPKEASFFSPPRALTQPVVQTIDIPFHTDRPQYSVLRLRCPLPSALSLLEKEAQRPDHIPLPSGYQLLHASSSAKQVALLLQNPDNNYPSLVTYQRPLSLVTPPTPQPLLSMFRQVRVNQEVTLLAGGLQQEGLLALTHTDTHTLLPGHPSVRYLDPIIHRQSRRIFVLQQWTIPGSAQRKPKAIFLISVPLPKKFPL